MSTHSHRPLRILAVTGLALTLGLTACGREDDGKDPVSDGASSHDATAEAALAGAAWLEAELQDGVLFNREFKMADYSTTVEAAYALLAVDEHSDAIAPISDALAAGVDAYASPGADVYAGSTAKLVSFAADTGADPRDFGGEDLVAQLEARTADKGPASGRISDKSGFGDYANSFGQAWAVRGLTLAESAEAEAARDFLLQQQCGEGFFRLSFAKPGAAEQGCGATAKPEPVDTTALAYVLLHELAEDDPILAEALDRGIDYIVSQQAEDGSFSGGSGTAVVPNTNSTGLAGWALHLAGEEEAAANAAAWVRAHQLGECEGKAAEEAGAIGFDDAAVTAAGKRGLTPKSEYQWRLATAQALPALLATPEGAAEAPCPTS